MSNHPRGHRTGQRSQRNRAGPGRRRHYPHEHNHHRQNVISDAEVFGKLSQEYECWNVQLPGYPHHHHAWELTKPGDSYIVLYVPSGAVWSCVDYESKRPHGSLFESALAGATVHPTARQAELHDALTYDVPGMPDPCDHILATRYMHFALGHVA